MTPYVHRRQVVCCICSFLIFPFTRVVISQLTVVHFGDDVIRKSYGDMFFLSHLLGMLAG